MKLLEIAGIQFEIHPYGSTAIRLVAEHKPTETSIPSVASSIYNAKHQEIDDVVGSEHEILVRFEHAEQKDIILKHLRGTKLEQPEGRSYKIPLLFSPEENEKFESTSLNKLKTEIEKIEFNISMFGFIPGFMYIKGLPDEFHVARKSNPSKNCKSGSVAIGGEYVGIYNVASPAGWNIIGETAVTIPFDGDQRLQIQDRIEFVLVDLDEHAEIIHKKLNIFQYNA